MVGVNRELINSLLDFYIGLRVSGNSMENYHHATSVLLGTKHISLASRLDDLSKPTSLGNISDSGSIVAWSSSLSHFPSQQSCEIHCIMRRTPSHATAVLRICVYHYLNVSAPSLDAHESCSRARSKIPIHSSRPRHPIQPALARVPYLPQG